jgi:putative Mn2+ efflux pump MntP
MDVITDILIGVGLALDAAAVSVTGGANARKNGKALEGAFLAGLFFGGFQAAMLGIGWLGGSSLKALVSGIDHWIAFLLLGIVGSRMVLESLQHHKEEGRIDLLDHRVMIALAFATSIDALAVGTGLAFADGGILGTALIVGAVTALISSASVFLGERYGRILGPRIETLGGIVLIMIGARILYSHLMP